jgi:transposase InsO family protein
MSKKRTYFPPTTPQQRKLLFEAWEETGSVAKACRKAHVGRSTFYYWKPRFDADGYAGLEKYKKKGPAKDKTGTPSNVKEKVIAMRHDHPEWGKHRIADELAKANSWVRVVSPNTVRRILEEAKLWSSKRAAPQRGHKTVVRYAERPGQTLNVDLCFVPAEHEAEVKIPAVSGSSGRLVVERAIEEQEPQYPGRIFENGRLNYVEVMKAFVAASSQTSSKETPLGDGKDLAKKEKRRRLREQDEKLRQQRRQMRKRRRAEDKVWASVKQRHREKEAALSQRRARWGERKAFREAWRRQREQRRKQLAQRRQENETWREQRRILHQQLEQFPVVSSWIAVLVVTDNFTRQCLGLPLFLAGSKVTSEMVTEALRTLLPPELQFLISDRGIHFTAQAFQKLAQSKGFVHVVIARHRPQSNGVAERFVRTLKEWLASHSWENAHALRHLLAAFHLEYNNRPHQGLLIPGLSPNELANRVWLM